jgi:cell volume regulation protein A
MTDGEMVLVAGTMLTIGLIASLLAVRVRIPALLLFLGLGMLIGSDGTGWIEFDDYELARTVGIIALALILFEGGLAAGFREIRPVLRPAIGLASVGTVLTAVLSGLAASWIFGFSTLEGLLLGSILASTDAAAVFSVLRGSTLRRQLARTLEGESGMNDPVAVLLVLGFIEWIQEPGYGALDMIWTFARELSIGAAAGLVVGYLAVEGFRRARLASGGLYPVASLATAAVAFGAADSLEGSGFLSVYLAGLVLGTRPIPARRTISAFHDGLSWVAQIAMFFTLGLLVFPSQLGGVWLEGTILAFLLVLLARPLAVLVATAAERYRSADRVMLGWAGFRGAVPVVLATFPVIEAVPHSLEFFNIVFFAVVLSTLLQGLTFEAVARRLGVTTSQPALPTPLAETGTIRGLGAEVIEYPVGPNDSIAGRRVRELGLPRDALLNVIVRHDEAIPPRGSTRIEAGDELHVLVRREVTDHVADLLERWREGASAEPARPRLPPRAHTSIFMARPWKEEDGDPAHPRHAAGVPVLEHLRTRRDVPGALVALVDGRYAITGPILAVGGPNLLLRHVRQQMRNADSDQEAAWWQEVAGALTSSAL